MAQLMKEKPKKSPAAEAFNAAARVLGIVLCVAVTILAYVGLLWVNCEIAEMASERGGVRFILAVLLLALEFGSAFAICAAAEAYRETQQ